MELERSLGADEILDYTAGDDFTKNRAAYDVVLDAVGRLTYMRSRRALKPGGAFVSADGAINILLIPLSPLLSKKVVMPVSAARKAEIELLRQLLESGDYRAVIDRTYPLEEIVEAARYVDTKQKVGNVVLTIS